VVESNWRYTTPAGSRVVVLKHVPAAMEPELDLRDVVLTNAVAITNTLTFEAFSIANGLDLVNDARPQMSQSPFQVRLTASRLNGSPLSGSNQLHLEFLAPSAPDRVYNARIRIDAAWSADQQPFECVTNLVQLARLGNRIKLPAMTNVPPGQAYGMCEIDCRFVDQTRDRCRLELLPPSGSIIAVAADAQAGCRIVDSIEASSTLATNSWQVVAMFTNDVAPDAASFEAGWKKLQYQVDTTQLPSAEPRFLRLSRQWLAP
jgi:hypothetical protein